MALEFANLTPKDDRYLANKFETLRFGILLPGDMMVSPPGYMCVEKMLNSTSIGIRSSMPTVHMDTMKSVEILNSAVPSLGCTCNVSNGPPDPTKTM